MVAEPSDNVTVTTLVGICPESRASTVEDTYADISRNEHVRMF